MIMILRMLTIMLKYEPITNVHPPPRAIPGPTRSYQVVSSSSSLSSSSTIAVIVCHHRHCHHHGVGCCFVPSAGTFILILVVQRRRNPTNEGITAASPPFPSPPAILPLPVAFPPSPPSRSPMAPSWTGMQRRRPCASAAVTASAMPRSPLRRPELDPPSLLGPPPPVGQWRRQHVDIDAHPGASGTARCGV
jgi:hypothetical protein